VADDCDSAVEMSGVPVFRPRTSAPFYTPRLPDLGPGFGAVVLCLVPLCLVALAVREHAAPLAIRPVARGSMAGKNEDAGPSRLLGSRAYRAAMFLRSQ
jgi:hypothetical protein